MPLSELPLLKSMRPIVSMPESTELELPSVRPPQIKDLPPNVKLPVRNKQTETPKTSRLPESVVRAAQRMPALPKKASTTVSEKIPNRPTLGLSQPAVPIPAVQPLVPRAGKSPVTALQRLPIVANKDNQPGLVPLPAKPIQRAQEILQQRPIMPTRQATQPEGMKKDATLQQRPQPVRIEGTLRLESDRSATITGTLLGGVPGS